MKTPTDRHAEAEQGGRDDDANLRFIMRYMEIEMPEAGEAEITAAAVRFIAGLEDD